MGRPNKDSIRAALASKKGTKALGHFLASLFYKDLSTFIVKKVFTVRLYPIY